MGAVFNVVMNKLKTTITGSRCNVSQRTVHRNPLLSGLDCN